MKKRFLRALMAAALLAAAAASLNAGGTSDLNAQTKETADGLRYERNEQGGATITKYTGTAATLVIPAEIKGLPVTAIGDSTFYGCERLTSVTFGAGSRIDSGNFGDGDEYLPFPGDLREKYFAGIGGAGTYTQDPANYSNPWTKQI